MATASSNPTYDYYLLHPLKSRDISSPYQSSFHARMPYNNNIYNSNVHVGGNNGSQTLKKSKIGKDYDDGNSNDGNHRFHPVQLQRPAVTAGAGSNYPSKKNLRSLLSIAANAHTRAATKSSSETATNRPKAKKKKSVHFQTYATAATSSPERTTPKENHTKWYGPEDYHRFKFDAANDAGVKLIRYSWCDDDDDSKKKAAHDQDSDIVDRRQQFVLVGDFDEDEDVYNENYSDGATIAAGTATTASATTATATADTDATVVATNTSSFGTMSKYKEYFDNDEQGGKEAAAVGAAGSEAAQTGGAVCKRGLGYHFSRIRKKERVFTRSAVLAWQKSLRDASSKNDGENDSDNADGSKEKQKKQASPVENETELEVDPNKSLSPASSLSNSPIEDQNEEGGPEQQQQQPNHQSEFQRPSRQPQFPPLDNKCQLILAIVSKKCTKSARQAAEWRGRMDYKVAYPERHPVMVQHNPQQQCELLTSSSCSDLMTSFSLQSSSDNNHHHSAFGQQKQRQQNIITTNASLPSCLKNSSSPRKRSIEFITGEEKQEQVNNATDDNNVTGNAFNESTTPTSTKSKSGHGEKMGTKRRK